MRQEAETTFVSYLIELRKRLLWCVSFLSVIFLILFFLANDLYHWLALPLLKYLPAEQQLIATSVTSPLFAPLKLAFVTAILISVPFCFYQLWSFISPALYTKEKKLIWPLLFASTLLFYLGIVFAYFIVFPLMFGFFTGIVPEGVKITPDMYLYLDFALQLLLTFGITFEIPVITWGLVASGVITREVLIEKRPYVIVLAFIIGMLLTPPDVLSQILLAVPMCLLYELGIYLTKFTRTKPSA